MKIELSEKQISTIKLALYLAGEWEENLSDSYKTDLQFIDGKSIRLVGKTFKKEFDDCIDRMRKFKHLLGVIKVKEKNAKKKEKK